MAWLQLPLSRPVSTCGLSPECPRPPPTAFPDQLTVSPATLVPGRDQEVACTAHSVSPAGPDTLSFSLLLGNRELEGVQALGREEEEDSQETEDLLFRVTERWLLPPLGTPAPPTLHCQATMRLPGLELSHRRALPGEPTGSWHPQGPPLSSLDSSVHPTCASWLPGAVYAVCPGIHR